MLLELLNIEILINWETNTSTTFIQPCDKVWGRSRENVTQIEIDCPRVGVFHLLQSPSRGQMVAVERMREPAFTEISACWLLDSQELSRPLSREF